MTALSNSQQFGETAARTPPIISAVTWARTDPDVPAYEPAELLTLVSDNHRQNSFAWNFLSFMSVTDHPAASINTSQSCATDVMLYSNGSGSPWATGSHVEVHHGEDAYGGSANPNAAGATIAHNIEFTRRSRKGIVIGIELNAGSSPLPPDVAINVGGRYGTGIQMAGNDLQMGGGRVWLTPNVFMHVNARGNPEFVKNGKPVKIAARIRDAIGGVQHPAAAPELMTGARPPKP